MRFRFILLLLIGLVPTIVFAQIQIVPEGKPEIISIENTRILGPSFSPDGKWLGFTSSNYRGIFLLNRETGKIKQLTDKAGAGYHFAWSPDGNFIAYRARIVENRRAKMAIEVADIQSGKVVARTAAEKRVGLPKWGETNSLVFYTVNERLQQLSTGIATTRRLRKLLKPDKKRIAFTRYDRLHVAEMERPDSLIQPLQDIRVINEVLSPSRNRVACEEYGGDLLVIDLQTGRRFDLGEGHRPCWAPDENWVCFMVTEDDGHRYLAADIYIASVDGKQRINLTQTDDRLEMNPSWSPDGAAIAYDEVNSGAIYIQKLRYEQK